MTPKSKILKKSKQEKWDTKLFGSKAKHMKAVALGKAREKMGSYGPDSNRNLGRP